MKNHTSCLAQRTLWINKAFKLSLTQCVFFFTPCKLCKLWIPRQLLKYPNRLIWHQQHHSIVSVSNRNACSHCCLNSDLPSLIYLLMSSAETNELALLFQYFWKGIVGGGCIYKTWKSMLSSSFFFYNDDSLLFSPFFLVESESFFLHVHTWMFFPRVFVWFIVCSGWQWITGHEARSNPVWDDASLLGYLTHTHTFLHLWGSLSGMFFGRLNVKKNK